jgi:hypothetical protein
MPQPKKRAVAKPPAAIPAPVVEAEPAAAPEAEDAQTPARPARGMTTEQIRRVGNRIAEHERDLKSSTSRR